MVNDPGTASLPYNLATDFPLTGVGECDFLNNIDSTNIALPSGSATGDATICQGDTVQLSATGGSVYNWTPSGELSCTNCPNPLAFPSISTTFVVEISDGGCSLQDSVTVLVTTPPPANAGPDENVCNGETTQLSATGGTAYSWSPPTGLSCTNCPDPIVNTLSLIHI